MKIGNKLFITYLIVLLVGFIVSGVSFHFLSQRYLLVEARKEIKAGGQFIASALAKVPLNDSLSLGENIVERRQLKVAGRFIESKIIVFNKQDIQLYSNLNQAEKKEFQQARQEKTFTRDYVSQDIPIVAENGAEKGHVIIYSKLKDIKNINLLAWQTEVISFLIAIFFALLIAWRLEKSLTRPIHQLMYSMNNFSVKEPIPELGIQTGDEIGELALCFNSMAINLNAYDERQKTFLQNTSHELKTPLMSIQGYAEAIKDGVVEGVEVERSLDIIIEESQRLKRVVEEIIYLTRLENVNDSFSFKLANLGEIVEKSIRSLNHMAQEREIDIRVEGDVNLDSWCDGEKLERVFINIISNGFRYANSSIIINCAVSNGKTVITVTDDGVGFKNGEENKIFDRFYRGENGGTGIGLAITKAIIEGHQGRIEAYNGENGGAVFKIQLPDCIKE